MHRYSILFCVLLISFLNICWPTSAIAQLHGRINPGITYSDTVGPLIYTDKPSDGEYGFIGTPAYTLRAKLIPNLQERKKLGLKSIDNIMGVTHFFLDHDLSSGFVHPYTLNFYNSLRPTDFVMKFTRSDSNKTKNDSMIGTVQYIYKKDVQKGDVLGCNIAFFRQWKLSEFDLVQDESGTKIALKYCKFASFCGCPQTKADIDNPYKPEIPIWVQRGKEGYVLLAPLNQLGLHSGGTVVIIWENKLDGNARIMFQDIHGPLDLIISTAMEIAKKYGTDPHIAISDAGPFARKVRAGEGNILDCQLLKNIAPRGEKLGAGFGYLPDQE